MFVERKEYNLGGQNKAISYEIHDDNGHVVQLPPDQTEALYQWLHDHAAQLHADVNGKQGGQS